MLCLGSVDHANWVLGRPPHAVAVLGSVGAFGALLWAVPLYVLGPTPQPVQLTTLLPVALCGAAVAFATGLWIGRHRRSRAEVAVLAAGQSRLAMVESQMTLAAERAATEAHRIALLLDSAAPGAALFDATHRLLAWSRGFAALAEVPEAGLMAGLPLADLVRLQPASPTRKLSRHGIESGVPGATLRQRGDGTHVEDRWSPGAEGGTLLTCRQAEAPRQAPPLTADALAALCEEEVRTRLPRLQAAIAAGNSVATRMEAHAIRGVAASFGLDALAEALLVLERSARAGDLSGLAAASVDLPRLAEAGLRRLLRQPA